MRSGACEGGRAMIDERTTATKACIIREATAAGYGSEDIAVMHRIPLSTVRSEVSELRARGDLKHMFA